MGIDFCPQNVVFFTFVDTHTLRRNNHGMLFSTSCNRRSGKRR